LKTTKAIVEFQEENLETDQSLKPEAENKARLIPMVQEQTTPVTPEWDW
jgi:hypothetical protein